MTSQNDELDQLLKDPAMRSRLVELLKPQKATSFNHETSEFDSRVQDYQQAFAFRMKQTSEKMNVHQNAIGKLNLLKLAGFKGQLHGEKEPSQFLFYILAKYGKVGGYHWLDSKGVWHWQIVQNGFKCQPFQIGSLELATKIFISSCPWSALRWLNLEGWSTDPNNKCAVIVPGAYVDSIEDYIFTQIGNKEVEIIHDTMIEAPVHKLKNVVGNAVSKLVSGLTLNNS